MACFNWILGRECFELRYSERAHALHMLLQHRCFFLEMITALYLFFSFLLDRWHVGGHTLGGNGGCVYNFLKKNN